MVIWHDHDSDGQGADADVLAQVIREMLERGIIRMTADGHVLPAVDFLANSGASEHAAHKGRGRTRGLTGMGRYSSGGGGGDDK